MFRFFRQIRFCFAFVMFKNPNQAKKKKKKKEEEEEEEAQFDISESFNLKRCSITF